MIEAFREQAVLRGELVRLEPLGVEHFDGVWAMLGDDEGRRLTGTHATFIEEGVRSWLSSRRDQHDRADWAVLRVGDGAFLGEVVLNELDEDNRSVNFRISLAGPHVFGRGYGTEATRLALWYAFDMARLHRVWLEVYTFNPRALRVYEKCGFVREGLHRDALWWDGTWHDAVSMAMLSTDPRPT